MQYCVVPGCSHLVVRGRCATHARQQEQQRPNRTVRRWYYTKRWALLRAIILRDAAYTCAQCGTVQVTLEVDHIRKHQGNLALFWDPQNLQALCPACHTRKTGRGE